MGEHFSQVGSFKSTASRIRLTFSWWTQTQTVYVPLVPASMQFRGLSWGNFDKQILTVGCWALKYAYNSERLHRINFFWTCSREPSSFLPKRNLSCQVSYDYSHHQGKIFWPNLWFSGIGGELSLITEASSIVRSVSECKEDSNASWKISFLQLTHSFASMCILGYFFWRDAEIVLKLHGLR